MDWNLAKTQTFGCEIEMNHILRKEAARVAADHFGTGEYGRGIPFHGHETWIAVDANGRKWQFVYDGSIAGAEPQRCEMVTPILTYDEDMELLQGLVRRLRDAGAVSNPTEDCGVHIHIGSDGHDGRSLRNLTNLMASHEMLLLKAVGVTAERARWCKCVDRNFLNAINNKKPVSKSGVQDLWYEVSDDVRPRTTHYHESRYRMLNLHALMKGTIEFRLFQFDNPTAERKNGLHAGKLRAYVMLALTLSQEAKEKRTISSKHVQMENEKFAMRTWMNRMGMIGPEFKAPHEHFLTKLDGDAAWRYGRPE